jgi:hypothetical protein
MQQNELEEIIKGLNKLKNTVKKLGMARANLHDIEIALAVVERVSAKVHGQRKAS